MTAVMLPEGPSPYHFGEQAVQIRMGVQAVSERIGRAFIRNYLTDQAKSFFEELPLLFVGVRNPDGSMWATTLCGKPGFVRATNTSHLSISLKQIYGDAATFSEGGGIGSVGVMLHNRRRNKLNGIVECLQPGNLTLKVIQSFGNCPKYITVRNIVVDDKQLATLGQEQRSVARGTTNLGAEARALIARSDTLFLATSFFGVDAGADGVNGCDCNIKGGAPGFVQVTGEGTLILPDFIGNSMFQSLGNIVADSRVGIQFIDFASGDSLQLTGKACILYDDRTLPGAQRAIEFVTSRWVYVNQGLPISTEGPVEPSPYTPLPTAAGTAGSIAGLKCISRRNETPDIVTFEFNAPRTAEGKAFCEAGQFASFDFADIRKGETLNRTWTISRTPKEIAATGKFTISVKKAGLVSSWLHNNLTVPNEVVFRGVDGDFTLDRAAKRIPPAGVLLIAGGIGVTPMRVMFAECIQHGYPVTLLYSIRKEEDAAFLEEFQEQARMHENVRLAVALTGGAAGDRLAGVLTFLGRLNAAMIQQACSDVKEREVFQCGPDTMMSSAVSALESLGLSTANIHQESFNF